MNDQKRMKEIMRVLATVIEMTLQGRFVEDMGFALLAYPHGKETTAHYISNSEMSDVIKALREAADRLEKEQDILPSINKIPI